MKVGSKVVCIDGLPSDEEAPNVPIRGEIYTVRYIQKTHSGFGLLLTEIVNPPYLYRQGIYEPCFKVERFRPVDDTYGHLIAEIIEKQLELETA